MTPNQKPPYIKKNGLTRSRFKPSNGSPDKLICQICRKCGHEATQKKQDCFRKEAPEGGLKNVQHIAAVTLALTSASVTDTDIAWIYSSDMNHESSDWYADSVASFHIPQQKEVVTDYRPIIPDSGTVLGIGDKSLQVAGIGDAQVLTMITGSQRSGTLPNGLHVPKLDTNLFSNRKATERGFTSKTVYILSKESQTSASSRLARHEMDRLDFQIAMPTFPVSSPT